MKKKVKLFTSKAVEIDEKNRTARFVISDDGVDRMEEVVEQSWDTSNYEMNPIVLWGHDPSKPENVMGNSREIETKKEGERTITTALAQFLPEGVNRTADMVFEMVKAGVLRTTSVGFIPHTFKNNDAGQDVLADNELLEFSIVPIPANPRAVALAYKEGAISKKDANFMIDSMKKESELLQKELENGTNNDKEKKSMNDADIAKLAEAIGAKMTEALTPLSEKLDTILEKVDADASEDSPEDTGTGEGTDATSTEEAQGKSAKGGESDQSGAEITEDSVLTPEQEKEFEAELAKALKD